MNILMPVKARPPKQNFLTARALTLMYTPVHTSPSSDHHKRWNRSLFTRLTPAQGYWPPGIRQGKGTRREQEGKKISIAENKIVTFNLLGKKI